MTQKKTPLHNSSKVQAAISAVFDDLRKAGKQAFLNKFSQHQPSSVASFLTQTNAFYDDQPAELPLYATDLKADLSITSVYYATIVDVERELFVANSSSLTMAKWQTDLTHAVFKSVGSVFIGQSMAETSNYITLDRTPSQGLVVSTEASSYGIDPNSKSDDDMPKAA